MSPLSPADQAGVARALPDRGLPGVAYQALIAVHGRRLCVNSVWRPKGAAAQQAFSAVVTRRSSARAHRLLPVVATGCHDDWHWVAYEFGTATPLGLDGWRRWPVAATLDLLSDIANPLDDAAAQGVFAYELVPASIFVDHRLGPLLADLGTAREAFGNPPVEHERGDGFVAPEVLSGQGADARSGVYACGALVYALVSGASPSAKPGSRADLPAGIDRVVARAMAHDSLERYSTAVDLCDSLRRALAEQVPAPAGEKRRLVSRPRRQSALSVAPNGRPAPVPQATTLEPVPPAAERVPPRDIERRPPKPRFLRPLLATFVLAAMALGVLAGLKFGTPAAPATDAGAEVVGDGVRMTLPPDWSAGVARGDVALSAYPSADWFSGISVRVEDAEFALPDRSDPVRVGALDVWRDRSEAPAVVRYVAPTTAGTLVVSCEAAAGAAPNTMRLCERAVATLRLQRGEPLPLPGVVDQPGLRAALTYLRKNRREGRLRLARARSPGAQRDAAAALARAYGEAGRRLTRVRESGGVADAVQRTAVNYRSLARAARSGKTRPWDVARDAVRRSEAAVATRLDADG